jgi:hypothetical protein
MSAAIVRQCRESRINNLLKGRFSIRISPIAGLILTLSFGVTGTWALACPVPHPNGGRNALQQSRTEIADLSSTFRHEGAAAIPSAAEALRRRHPQASKGEILNYLITAYCPVVNRQSGKSERQKQQAIQRFGQTARSLVYN